MASQSPRAPDPEKTVSFVRGLVKTARLAWGLLRDARVSRTPKIAWCLAFLYVLSPIDFLPDFILGLGQLDDLAIIFIATEFLVQSSPPEVVAEIKAKIGG